MREPIPFLANIILVAHADGKLSPQELYQLDEIRKEEHIKKTDFSAAQKLVNGGTFRLTPVGTFADQIKNLECIIRVALTDKDLDSKEVDIINRFSQTIGIHQDQLDRLRMEVLASLEQVGQRCVSCGSENTANAQFCGKCGSSLAATSQAIELEFVIPANGLTIEFAESTAAAFPKALALAKNNPGFRTCKKGKKTWYLATYPGDDVTDALPLAEALSGIRNRCLYLNGKEETWNNVFGFSWCATQRAAAYRPTEYCFGKDENRLNPWGCKQARMDWTEWAGWFCYGLWEKKGVMGRKVVWRFDKARIKHEVATNLYKCRYCPHLNTELSEAIIRNLPDTVDPSEDVYWGFHESYEQLPGAIKVIQKEQKDGYTYTNEFWADGVKPKGYNALIEVLHGAFRDLGEKAPPAVV